MSNGRLEPPPPQQTAIAIVSGRAPASFMDSATNHQQYANRHGYCFVETNWFTPETNRYKNKIRYILHVLPYFDYVMWIDDDAFFTDLNVAVNTILPQGQHFAALAYSSPHDAVPRHLASGSLIIRNVRPAHEWLKEGLRLDLNHLRDLWDAEWGYFSGGDQDALVYLLRTKYPDNYGIIEKPMLQGRIEDLKHDSIDAPFVTHMTGTYSKKLRKYLAIIRYFEGSISALPYEQEELLNSHVSVLYRLWRLFARTVVVLDSMLRRRSDRG